MLGSVKFLMCSKNCKCSDSGAFADVGGMCNVHCAVCRVKCAEDLSVETGWVKLKFYH